MKKKPITTINVNMMNELILSLGSVYIHRGINKVHIYKIVTLTQYQRAVRLLNAFVERNMK